MKLEKPNEKTFQGIHNLIKYYAEKQEMLYKSLDDLYRVARGFRVIVDEKSANKVIACAHLDLFSPVLAEVKSLAVDPAYQGQGLGRIIVEDCEREARALGIKELFALTYKEKFFEKLDFSIVDINTLPEKVFKECVLCPFYENCNEIAVLKRLN